MVNPRYSGRTSDGLPFYLIADTAIRRRSDLDTVLLTNPILEFVRDEGVETSSVIAKTGSYNDMSKILELETDVNLETDDGNTCDTTHARIFNVEKRIEGDEAISCFGAFGTVTGNSYAIEDAYRTFIFKDGMTADLKNDDQSSDEDSTFGFGGDGPIDVKAEMGIYQGDKTDLRGDVRVEQDGAVTVSYTHLTLPTILRVSLSACRVSPTTKPTTQHIPLALPRPPYTTTTCTYVQTPHATH